VDLQHGATACPTEALSLSLSRWARASLIVHSTLGLLLITAALLKIHGLWFGTSLAGGLFASPRLQVATIEIEIIVGGLLLLSGRARRLAWGAALAWFAILALASLYMGLDGQADCGCLGAAAKVNPWWIFAVDIVAITALLFCRPRATSPRAISGRLPAVLRVAAGAAAFVVLITGGFLLSTDDPESALARLRGDSVSIIPALSEMGQGVRGERRSFTVVVRNNTRNLVRVVGGTSNCNCITTRDLPFTLGPNESCTIQS
jgi:hypothetical protein